MQNNTPRSFRRVAVYCASSTVIPARYFDAARSVGALLARRGVGIVCGGGRVGLMGALADAALAEGGEVVGVIPQKLYDLEVGHRGLSELFVVDSMRARKSMMAALADAFVALPGGWGTLEELFEVATMTQLNYHDKPVGILNVGGYFDALLAFLARAADEGFVRPVHQTLIQVDEDMEGLLDKLSRVPLPRVADWAPKLPPS